MTTQPPKKGFWDRNLERYQRAERFISHDLWTDSPRRPSQGILIRVLRTCVLTIENFLRSDLSMMSAALTYSVAFALVPLLTVIMAFLQGFGGLAKAGDAVKRFLVSQLDPSANVKFAEYIDTFLTQVNATAVGVVGFLLLLYTSFSLLSTIEGAFNQVWGVKKSRPLHRRLVTYWMLLTLSPIFLALSLAASTFVQNQPLMTWLSERAPFVNTIFLQLASFGFAWILFGSLYLIMPNTHVNFAAALAGALVAGTIWGASKQAYVWYNTRAVFTHQVYGSLSLIPVFLLWVYLSWMLVLFGAEVAFAAQHVKTYRREVETPVVGQRFKERLALMIVLRVVRAFIAGEDPPTADGIARALKTPVRLVNEIIYQLSKNGILREVVLKSAKDAGLLPARDITSMTVKSVLMALDQYGEDPFALPEAADTAGIDCELKHLQEHAYDKFEKLTVKELVERGYDPGEECRNVLTPPPPPSSAG